MVSPTHRVGLSESELISLAELLHNEKLSNGLTKELAAAALKFNTVITKAELGLKKADYIPTGTKRVGAINLDSLGASEEDKIAINRPKSPSHVSMAEDELEAELERLNREMLEQVAAEGNQNVVLTERRATPRIDSVGSDTTIVGNDDALFNSL